jgi:hypothetical protein
MARSWHDSDSPHRVNAACCALMAWTVFLCGCIRPQNYHALPNRSTFHYRYLTNNSQGYGRDYFSAANAYECYIEFDARGAMYRDREGKPTQLKAAVDLIHAVKGDTGGGSTPGKIALYVFVHGWKNNASEEVGNVWGFRRFLSDIAAQQGDIPVIGVYMGWPGASLKGDQFLTFWSREPIADMVGQAADFQEALKKVLQAAKGDSFDSPDGSIAVVIGHSFGGVVLEHAATSLLKEQLDKARAAARDSRPMPVPSPADLFVLINEAGAASIARPFLLQLELGGARYKRGIEGEGRDYPLLLSMTSVGDIATKFGYPGGEFGSINRTATVNFTPPDVFGQTSSLPYNLLTAANMVALQSHAIVPLTAKNPTCDPAINIPIRLSSTLSYCIQAVAPSARLNHTPYWIMQLPQVFVPDHSSVFQDYLLNLLTDVLAYERLIAHPKANRLPVAAPSGQPPPPPPPPTTGGDRPLVLTTSPQP